MQDQQTEKQARAMLDYQAELIARDVAKEINKRTESSRVQYAAQYTLEKVIESLQARV